jgi:radical SAM superfamily enzyme YgiQ (UPF0313 family)
VLIAGINSSWYQSNPALYYLRNSLRGLPMRITLREFTTSEPLFDVLAAIVECRPDVACFSAYVWNSLYLAQLIPELKKLMPDLKIVVGGPDAANLDGGLEQYCILARGPGEGLIRHLAESGFNFPAGTYEYPAPHLKDLPFLYRKQDKPQLENKLVYYECSRGCPFRCAYCLSANDKRNEVRFDPSLPADRRRLYRELDQLLELHPRTLKFVDRSFNAHSPLARLVWEFAINCKAECEFHFEIYPDLLNGEDFQILAKAPPGRIRFEVGIQTINPTVNRVCNRNSNWHKAKTALISLRERTNICIHSDLLAGLPGERIGSVMHSLDELASCLPTEIQLGILKIIPDTPMQSIARQRGYKWMDRQPWQVLSTDTLSFKQVSKLQEIAKIINLYWNKGEYRQEWQSLLERGSKASDITLRLLDHHRKHSITLHSVSKASRAEVFSHTVQHL